MRRAFKILGVLFGLGLILAVAVSAPALAQTTIQATDTPPPGAEGAVNRIEREGIVIEFGLRSLLAGGLMSDPEKPIEVIEGDNAEWLVERHGYRAPRQIRAELLAEAA